MNPFIDGFTVKESTEVNFYRSKTTRLYEDPIENKKNNPKN